MILQAFWFFITTAYGSTENQCQQKNYVLTNQQGSVRLTSIQKGNYTIQGILKFSDDDLCSKVSLYGLINAYAFQYAIDLANNDESLTQWANIGIRLDDNCNNLPLTMALAIEYVSMVRPNSVCRPEFLHCMNETFTENVEPASAIVGTDRSTTTIPLSGLMSLYQIPTISHAASSPVLSKSIYRSFFRTIPSDVHQVSAMLDLIKYFGWTYIIVIGSDDDYGRLAVADFQNRTANSSICIEYTSYIPVNSADTNSSVLSAIDKIKTLKSTVIILFCYVYNLGEKVLNKAQEIGLNRVWLTSDAWFPSAENLKNLNNQLTGIITVSVRNRNMPKLINFIKNSIRTKFLCNMWLKNYLNNTFNCEPTNISNDNETLFGKNNCSIKINNLLQNFSALGEKTSTLVDAVTILTRAILKFLQLNCVQKKKCFIQKIDPITLTNIVRNTSFWNDEHELIQFDQSGDSTFIFYSIENLQLINNTLKFVSIGNWSKNRINSLILNYEQIRWPSWFEDLKIKQHPSSQCFKNCENGQYTIRTPNCCWTCENCTGKNYSNTTMAEKCSTCSIGYHTIDHITCIKTPVKWLTFRDAEGSAILFTSFFGLLLTLIACSLLLKFREFIVTDESSPHIISLSCIMCLISFCFGFIQIVEPSTSLCHVRNGMFFSLFMGFSSVLIIKTKYFKKHHEANAKYFLKGRLFITQLITVLFLLIVELCTITAWVSIDGDRLSLDNKENQSIYLIEKRCVMVLTAGRLVSIFIPFILIIAATFCTLRERNKEHTFYEPKFLSFGSIALCIVVVAFLPTYVYVSDDFRGVVMAFTTNILGFTFIACLVLPKVYVGQARFRHGPSILQVKPARVKKPRPENSVEPKKTVIDGDAETTVTKVTSGINEGFSKD
ncbi:extracellular calcium-sensing receptor isoform X1 [Hydra vulgaris]|uniref:extracellular calcium-sensing receptor isoform X1 n=1 Tax=Hydra vulgaris TaxID=6087 RepID=UPI00019240AB|nr:extracellular calcium-sensing receptor-like [Hydra vulgaris]